MKFKAFIVTVFLAFPVSVRLTDIGFNNFKTIVGLSIFFFGVYTFIQKKKKNKINYKEPLLQFNILFLILVILQWFLHGNVNATLKSFVSQISPLISSVLLIFFISNHSTKYQEGLLKKIIIGIVVIFLFQFSLSLYESLKSMPLIQYGLLERNNSLELLNLVQRRSLLELIGINIGSKLPLTMLLGEHNYSAPLLAIYNLIFLFAFHR